MNAEMSKVSTTRVYLPLLSYNSQYKNRVFSDSGPCHLKMLSQERVLLSFSFSFSFSITLSHASTVHTQIEDWQTENDNATRLS